MNESERRTITISEELVEIEQRLMKIEKKLGREARVRMAKHLFMVVGLVIEALGEEVRRLEKERPFTAVLKE